MELILLFVTFVINLGKFCTAGSEQLFTKCRPDDAECMTENAIKLFPRFMAGMPEYGVECMDPFTFDHANASKLDLKFVVYNTTFKGLKDCIPLDVHRDAAKSKLHLTFNCPQVTGEAQYELSGKMLALDVHGGGPVSCLLRQVETHLEMDLEVIFGKNSKKYLRVNKFKLTFDLKGKSNVYFENLFQNNKELSKAALDLVNNSGNDIIREIGMPIFEVTAASAIKNLNNFFAHIPIEELYIAQSID